MNKTIPILDKPKLKDNEFVEIDNETIARIKEEPDNWRTFIEIHNGIFSIIAEKNNFEVRDKVIVKTNNPDIALSTAMNYSHYNTYKQFRDFLLSKIPKKNNTDIDQIECNKKHENKTNKNLLMLKLSIKHSKDFIQTNTSFYLDFKKENNCIVLSNVCEIDSEEYYNISDILQIKHINKFIKYLNNNDSVSLSIPEVLLYMKTKNAKIAFGIKAILPGIYFLDEDNYTVARTDNNVVAKLISKMLLPKETHEFIKKLTNKIQKEVV